MTRRIDQARADAQGLGLDPLDVDVLLCEVLQKPRSYLFAWPEKTLSEDEQVRFNDCCRRRLQGEPVAYITGVREFWSLPIHTAPHTLIPRPDTEVLVETVLDTLDAQTLRCIDLGTGTGAIALALKSERPHWQISGRDRVPEAVELARKNAERLQLDVSFEEGDWCAEIAEGSVDVLVSNPPYIDAEDPHLVTGDVRFEPASALIAGNSGLADIEQIAGQAVQCLKGGGFLFVEHGWTQGEAVRDILTQVGFGKVATRRDYGGRERVTFGERPEK